MNLHHLDPEPAKVEMNFGDHLEDLRHHVIRIVLAFLGTCAVCFVDQSFYMRLILIPHQSTMQKLHLPQTIQVLRYEESFFCHLKVAIIAAAIWTAPFALYQLWLFLRDALYEHEKAYIQWFLPAALLFFIAGILFGFYILIPLGLAFLAGYGSDIIQVGFTLSSYLSLFFVLTFVAGITFELPLIMFFLTKLHLVRTAYYMEKWRYFVLIAFVVAAVLTPPDAVTQLLLAIPMILLYFLGIAVCHIEEKFQELKELYISS